MDPHYLQRVAMAGSRTSASARPAVAGPPQMPGVLWSFGLSNSPEGPISLGVAEEEHPQFRPSSSHLVRTQSAEVDREIRRTVDRSGPSGAEPAGDVEPAPRGENGIARRSAAGVQEGSRLLPPTQEEPRETIRRVLPVSNEVSITAPKGLRPATKPPATADESVLHPRIPEERSKLESQPVIPSVLRPGMHPPVPTPRGLRPVPDPATAAADEFRVELRTDAETQRALTETPIPAQPGAEPRSLAASGDGSRLIRVRSPTVAKANALGSLEATAPAAPPSFEPTGTAALEGPLAAPPAQVVAVATSQPGFVPKAHELPVLPPSPAPTASSESRITIGRVEVQVNNRWPQLPAASRSQPVSVSRPPSALLEAYYLNRFPLRP
jgi:hypothetical protein